MTAQRKSWHDCIVTIDFCLRGVAQLRSLAATLLPQKLPENHYRVHQLRVAIGNFRTNVIQVRQQL